MKLPNATNGLSLHPTNLLQYNSPSFTSYPSSSSTSSSSSCSSYSSMDPSLLTQQHFNSGIDLQHNLFLSQQLLATSGVQQQQQQPGQPQMSQAQLYQYHLLATNAAKIQQQNHHLANKFNQTQDSASKMIDWIFKSQASQSQSNQLNHFLLNRLNQQYLLESQNQYAMNSIQQQQQDIKHKLCSTPAFQSSDNNNRRQFKKQKKQ